MREHQPRSVSASWLPRQCDPPPHTPGPFPPHHDERVIQPRVRRKPSPFNCFWSGVLLQQWETELKQSTTHTAMQRNPVITKPGETDTPKWLLEKLRWQKAVCEPSQAEPLSCQKLGQRLSLLVAMSGRVGQMRWSCWIALCLVLGIWYWAWWLALRVTLVQSRHTWEEVLDGQLARLGWTVGHTRGTSLNLTNWERKSSLECGVTEARRPRQCGWRHLKS